MQFVARRVCLLAFLLSLVGGSLAVAAPILSINPATIDRAETGTVEIQVIGLHGGSPQLRLHLIVDADGDGVVEPEDYPVWTTVVDDNTPAWSPAVRISPA